MARKAPQGLVDTPENLFRRQGRTFVYFVKKFFERYVLQFVVCIFLIFIHVQFIRFPALDRIELIGLDTFFKMRGDIEMHPDITYIEISEDSLQDIGRWPWPRHYHAALSYFLHEWGAEAIVFDMIFSEPSNEKEDGAFHESLRLSKNVYMPVALEKIRGGLTWIHSLPQFEQNVKGLGHFNIYPDHDGTVRRIKPKLSDGETEYPYLPLQVAYDFLGQEYPSLDEMKMLDDENNMLINWAGTWTGSFNHISYVDLLKSYEALRNGKEPIIKPSQIRGKICLIGLTALGHTDIKANPLEATYPGLGLHANIINSVLTDQYIRAASLKENKALLLLVGVFATLLFVRFRNIFSFIFGLGLGALWYVASYWIFKIYGLWLHTFYPLLMILSLFVFTTAYHFVIDQREKIRLFELAIRDGLTGLYVIRYFREVLNDAFVDSRFRSKPLALILLDIDHFKKFNDTYGHAAGDYVLKEVAKVMTKVLRQRRRSDNQKDTLARYGGEEFIMVLRNCRLNDAFFKVAERLREAVEKHPFEFEDQKMNVTISLGVASRYPFETVPDNMVRRADEALYRAKEEGRNCVVLEEHPHNGPKRGINPDG